MNVGAILTKPVAEDNCRLRSCSNTATRCTRVFLQTHSTLPQQHVVTLRCAVLCCPDVRQVTAAIVTCGGLCPGLNDVVQNIVFTLTDYGVPEDQILGIRYGLRGFYEREDKPVTLTRRMVEGIHLKGGTMLVSSSCL